ncbi:MAG: 1-(5-phosphoribosyl)-5-((5-phosphoribosylamino)methylideneamino)imidazole-4-carboxamide isomerase, partial [Clostridia bacterium]|nr:1-(5-phosphoribosyl)-5-((5-phosphoribosylamino)methylideneamino)imidazole-4-carboxamide isomerase [Clostridia bacterium]
MKIFPAIDIIEGKVVRLCKGSYADVKNYSLTPVEAAAYFFEQGASNLHVVDLDGAKSGNADNAKTIEKIASGCNMFVEVGGGIRSFD